MMKANVVSLADYKAKKKEMLQSYYNMNWWVPTFYFYFIPPFFWGIKIA